MHAVVDSIESLPANGGLYVHGRRVVAVRLARGEPILDLGDTIARVETAAAMLPLGAAVWSYIATTPDRVLRYRHGRTPRRGDEGDVRQDWAMVQARAAGAKRIWQDSSDPLRAPWRNRKPIDAAMMMNALKIMSRPDVHALPLAQPAEF